MFFVSPTPHPRLIAGREVWQLPVQPVRLNVRCNGVTVTLLVMRFGFSAFSFVFIASGFE
jgi:hypothetical protein